MSAFLIYSICMLGLAAILRLLALAFGDYPRNVEYARWEDALGLLVSAALIVWASILLTHVAP